MVLLSRKVSSFAALTHYVGSQSSPTEARHRLRPCFAQASAGGLYGGWVRSGALGHGAYTFARRPRTALSALSAVGRSASQKPTFVCCSIPHTPPPVRYRARPPPP